MIANEQITESAVASHIIDDDADVSGATGRFRMVQTICVDIFISEHCFVCEYSHEVAAFIRNKFPQVRVQMINMHDPEIKVPDVVFATPTYLLNGKLWSLGNPSNEEILCKLKSLLADM